MKKLTDAEVVKALEICSDTIVTSCPDDCPFYDECENDLCSLERHALELIKRKDAEIKRLKAEIRNTDNALASLDRPLIEVKIEAYNEFAERLKETIPHYIDGYTTMECVMGAIRYIEKELTEGTKNENE